MGRRYDNIQRFERNLRSTNLALVAADNLVYEHIAELMLEPLEMLQDQWNNREDKSVQNLLIARLFSGFEAVKLLILSGLLDHSHMPLRDTFECMLLLRLFEVRPNLAIRWITKLKSIDAATARAILNEAGFETPEYVLWETESGLSHANAIGSAPRVTETEMSEGVNRSFNFGGFRQDRHVRLLFRSLIGHMTFALVGPLTEVYMPYFSEEYGQKWLTYRAEIEERFQRLPPIPSVEDTSAEPPTDYEQRVERLVYARLRMDKLNVRPSGK
jgi:hypothetical protein